MNKLTTGYKINFTPKLTIDPGELFVIISCVKIKGATVHSLHKVKYFILTSTNKLGWISFFDDEFITYDEI